MCSTRRRGVGRRRLAQALSKACPINFLDAAARRRCSSRRKRGNAWWCGRNDGRRHGRRHRIAAQGNGGWRWRWRRGAERCRSARAKCRRGLALSADHLRRIAGTGAIGDQALDNLPALGRARRRRPVGNRGERRERLIGARRRLAAFSDGTALLIGLVRRVGRGFRIVATAEKVYGALVPFDGIDGVRYLSTTSNDGRQGKNRDRQAAPRKPVRRRLNRNACCHECRTFLRAKKLHTLIAFQISVAGTIIPSCPVHLRPKIIAARFDRS